MPNNHYFSKPTSLRCHLMAKHCLEVGRKRNLLKPRNLPSYVAVKVWQTALQSVLGVFITLLYTYTMPNNHYSSKPTSLRCHLMAKHCLRAQQKIEIFPDLRHEICPHVAVKVWQRALQSVLGVFITFLYTYTMPNNHYSSKPTSLRCHLMAKHCLRAQQKIEIFSWYSEAWNLPTHVAVKVWQRALQSVLGVFITFLYTYTMPNNHYSSKPTSLRCHLMAKRCHGSGQKIGIWGKKSALMWL